MNVGNRVFHITDVSMNKAEFTLCGASKVGLNSSRK